MKALFGLLICTLCVGILHAQTPRLIAPNGGEQVVAGTPYSSIRWTGTNTGDVISLDYTTNAGTSWNPIANSLAGTSMIWNPVPAAPSKQCRVRITVQRSSGGGDTVLSLQPIDPAHSFSSRRTEFDPTGAWVVTADEGGWVRVYNTVTTALRWEDSLCDSYIMNARYSPDGSMIAAYTARDSIILLDAATGAEIRRWHTGITSFPGLITDRSCAFSPDGTMLAVSTYQHVRLFNPATGAMIREMTQFSEGGVNIVEWTANSQRFLAGMASGKIYVVDAVTGATVQTFQGLFTIETASFSPNGSKIASTSRSQAFVQMWDVATGAMDFQIATSNVSGFNYPSVRFAKDGLSIFTSGEGLASPVSMIRQRSAADGSVIATPRYARLGLGALSIDPTETRFACVSGYGAVVLQPSTGGSQTLTDESDSNFEIVDDQRDSAEIYVPSVTAAAGDVVQVPVKIRGALAVKATSLTVNLQCKANVLEPVTPPAGTAIVGGMRVMPLTLPARAGADSVLLTIPFRVMLSTDSVTTLDLDSTVSVQGGTAIVTSADGMLSVNICREGNPRLVDGSRVLKIRTVGPNLVSGKNFEADIELIEPGVTSLSVVDAFGNTASVVAGVWMDVGTHRITVPIENCPSGAYSLVLHTPNQTRILRFMVVR